jgi:hypothetical protein
MRLPSPKAARKLSWVQVSGSLLSSVICLIVGIWAILEGTLATVVLGVLGLAVSVYFARHAWKDIPRSPDKGAQREE